MVMLSEDGGGDRSEGGDESGVRGVKVVVRMTLWLVDVFILI